MAILHVLSGVLICLGAATPLGAAQSQITTAAIDATVVDASGAVLRVSPSRSGTPRPTWCAS